MQVGVWLALVTLFVFGGLTPGPAVMLVTTSSMRYGVRPSMAAALGICAANLVWIALATSGASVLAHAFPVGFSVLKLVGAAYVVLLAWGIATAGPVDLAHRAPSPRARLFGRGLGLQLANPNALVYFGGLLPAYIDPHASLVVQCAVIMPTVTTTELMGLVTYALAARWLARRFASSAFAAAFHGSAAFVMAASAVFAVYSTWVSPGR